MKITFDSNSWEKVFDPLDHDCSQVRAAISSGRITGFICDAGFRIEAIRKRERAAYFAELAMEVRFPFSPVIKNGKPYVQIMSFGSNNEIHPGLPEVQANEKVFVKACAEWADGELVASHIAYRNDLLCTNDLARAAGKSIFDPTNRAWLTAEFGVQFITLAELLKVYHPCLCRVGPVDRNCSRPVEERT